MVNHAKPALPSGSKSGLMKLVLSPFVNPPPCTMMQVRNGPAPSGTHASSVRLTSPALANSMSVFSSARAVRVDAVSKKRVVKRRIVERLTWLIDLIFASLTKPGDLGQTTREVHTPKPTCQSDFSLSPPS